MIVNEESLLQQDVSIPDRYWATLELKAGSVPEGKLMLALLESAMRVYRDSRFKPSNVRRREVEQWLFEEESNSPIPFRFVCDALDLDAEAIRRAFRSRSNSVNQHGQYLSLEEKIKSAANP